MRALIISLVGIALLAVVINWRKSAGTKPPTAASQPTEPPGTNQPAAVRPMFRKPTFVRRSAIPPELPLARFRTAPADRPLGEASAEERMEYNRALLKQGPSELFALWLNEAGRMNDRLKLEFISDVLSLKLRGTASDTGEVLAAVDQFIQNGENDDYLRCHLLVMLGETATPEALQFLLRHVQSEPEASPLRRVALHQVAGIGDNLWGNRSHPELSPFVEQAWKSAGADEKLQGAAAMAIAKLGTESGVGMLLVEVLNAGATVEEFEQKAGDSAWAAFDALGEVANPACIPMLDSRLQGGAPGSLATVAVGHTLAAMGHPDATRALLKWIQRSPVDVGPFVKDWLSKAREETSLSILGAAIDAPNSFANGKNHRHLADLLNSRRIAAP
jgi:hypothetical protein